jgi:hypothetical protein
MRAAVELSTPFLEEPSPRLNDVRAPRRRRQEHEVPEGHRNGENQVERERSRVLQVRGTVVLVPEVVPSSSSHAAVPFQK